MYGDILTSDVRYLMSAKAVTGIAHTFIIVMNYMTNDDNVTCSHLYN